MSNTQQHEKSCQLIREANKNNNPADVGVIVGRFQVDQLHEGHKALFNYVAKRHARWIVVLGVSAMPGGRRNPLDLSARIKMIRDTYPQAEIASVNDQYDDISWSVALDDALNPFIAPHQSVVLYGGRDGFVTHYHGKYPTQILEGGCPDITATNVRHQVMQITRDTADFRAGVIYGVNNRYDAVYAVVDVAPIKEGQVLLARKNMTHLDSGASSVGL